MGFSKDDEIKYGGRKVYYFYIFVNRSMKIKY